MAHKKRRNSTNSGAAQERRILQTIDDISELEEFRRDILPELRQMIKNKAKPEEMVGKFRSHLIARTITIALSETDPAKALAAVKEALDRTSGKSVERREISMTQVSDEDLEKLIKEELEAVKQ